MGALNILTLRGEPVGVIEPDDAGVEAFVNLGPQFFWDTRENLERVGCFNTLHDALVAVVKRKGIDDGALNGSFILEERKF